MTRPDALDAQLADIVPKVRDARAKYAGHRPVFRVNARHVVAVVLMAALWVGLWIAMGA